MHKKNVIKAICWLCSLLFLFLFCNVPISAETPIAPDIEGAGAVLMTHLQSGTVVCSKNEQETVFAGSTVKILSGLLFCEAFRGRTQETLLITEEMLAPVSGFHMRDLTAGDVLTVEQLLYASVCGSYNDAFYILAFYHSGSVAQFVEQMNQRASQLGIERPSFTDPTGIDDASRISAVDLFKIASAAYQNDFYMSLCSTVKYQMSSTLQMEAQTVYNRNELISSHMTTQYYNGKCKGMSAGYTQKGGNCVVTVSTHGGESYLCIVLGGADTEQINYGYAVANRLIDWVYKTYAYMEVLSPQTLICTIPVTVAELATEVEVKAKESVSAYLPSGLEIGKDIHYSIRLTHTSLEAPVTEGIFVGHVAVIYNGEILATAPLYTASTAERSGFIGQLKDIEAWTSDRAVRAGLIFFVTVLLAWIITENVIRIRRRHKWDKYFSDKMALPQNKPMNVKRKK